ncbi:MAG: nucleotide exchange factor GrpE [Thermoplasmatota archaeon]
MPDSDAADESSVDPAAHGSDEELSRLRSEVADLRRVLDAATAQNERTRAELARSVETAKRVAADWDNARKRIDREREEMRKSATVPLLKQLLDVAANFDRALEAAGGDEAAHEGISLIYKQFRAVLSKEGVERIDSIGHVFDPHVHEAVMSEAAPGYPEGTIMAEFEPGWTYHGKVLRHAKVKVARAPDTGAPSPS